MTFPTTVTLLYKTSEIYELINEGFRWTIGRTCPSVHPPSANNDLKYMWHAFSQSLENVWHRRYFKDIAEISFESTTPPILSRNWIYWYLMTPSSVLFLYKTSRLQRFRPKYTFSTFWTEKYYYFFLFLRELNKYTCYAKSSTTILHRFDVSSW